MPLETMARTQLADEGTRVFFQYRGKKGVILRLRQTCRHRRRKRYLVGVDKRKRHRQFFPPKAGKKVSPPLYLRTGHVRDKPRTWVNNVIFGHNSGRLSNRRDRKRRLKGGGLFLRKERKRGKTTARLAGTLSERGHRTGNIRNNISVERGRNKKGSLSMKPETERNIGMGMSVEKVLRYTGEGSSGMAQKP